MMIDLYELKFLQYLSLLSYFSFSTPHVTSRLYSVHYLDVGRNISSDLKVFNGFNIKVYSHKSLSF